MITDSQQTSSPDIEAYLAMQLLKDGDRHAAIDKCHEAISQYGPNRNLYLVKARAHLELEEYGFAQEALLSLLSLDPEHPAGWALLGEAYFQLDNMPKVDYCRNRLKQIFPTLTEPDEVEESNSADDTSGQATRRQDEESYPVGQEPCGLDDIPTDRAGEDACRAQESYPVGQDPRDPANIPVGQDPRGLDDIPASGAETRHQDETAHNSYNPPSNAENGEPAMSIVPLEEVADTQTPSKQPLSESTQTPAGGIIDVGGRPPGLPQLTTDNDRAGEDACRAPSENIVDDLIATDLRINEQAEGTAKINVEIFETATFADICLAQGKYEKALEIYTKLSMIHPDNAEYREKINSIQAKMGSR